MEQWIGVAKLEEIPVLGSRVVQTLDTNIAVFRGTNDQVFAVRDACPHKNGPLSQGIMHDGSVTCPLHNWRINLMDGKVLGPDEGCVAVYPIKVEGGRVYLQLTPSSESEEKPLKDGEAKENSHLHPLAFRGVRKRKIHPSPPLQKEGAFQQNQPVANSPPPFAKGERGGFKASATPSLREKGQDEQT